MIDDNRTRGQLRVAQRVFAGTLCQLAGITTQTFKLCVAGSSVTTGSASPSGIRCFYFLVSLCLEKATRRYPHTRKQQVYKA
jgi:hypothetical protein